MPQPPAQQSARMSAGIICTFTMLRARIFLASSFVCSQTESTATVRLGELLGAG